MDTSALRMTGIRKRFGGVVALDGVDFDVRFGEVHALVGENGAGKSTLMKVLSGALRPDAGTMTVAGVPYAPSGPREARQGGVAMIYQELNLAPHLTVEDNVVLGREPSRFGIVDRKESRRIVLRSLEELGASDIRPERRISDLTPAERQVVEIARALSLAARVVVMDEPTSCLSRRETEALFRVIERLCEGRLAVVYISHFVDEIVRLAHRFTVLRDGKNVQSGRVPREETEHRAFVEKLLESMSGRPLVEAFPRVSHTPGPVVLDLERVAGARQPKEASLELRRGEIFGIAGLVGAGRTELLRAVFGLDPLRRGRVRVASNENLERRDRAGSPSRRLAQGVGLLSENRKDEGLALGLSIADNVTLSCAERTARFGWIDAARRNEKVLLLVERLGIRCREVGEPVRTLSGGNQQKTAIARLLHHDVDVFLLDEPTRGIDVASKTEIYRLMGELAARGKAILFVSSYLPELLGVCDRIAVMHRGILGPARPVAEWSETTLLEAATTGTVG